MPAGEEMFNYHGYSGPCPKPPLSGVLHPVTDPYEGPTRDAPPVNRRPTMAKRMFWFVFYFAFAGLNFGYALRDHDFSSGFNLAVALLCVRWAYRYTTPSREVRDVR